MVRDIDNLHPVIKELLNLRGISSKEDIFDFFFQDIYSLSNPFNIKDVNVFVDRVKEAINNNEKILIYGDKDADGITAASIIYNTLKVVTKNVEAFVPNHETGYGLSKTVIEEYANSGVSLIITVDCGISNVEEVEFARDLSIDIIVTDHHDIPEIIPNAYAVFNPKLFTSSRILINSCFCLSGLFLDSTLGQSLLYTVVIQTAFISSFVAASVFTKFKLKIIKLSNIINNKPFNFFTLCPPLNYYR